MQTDSFLRKSQLFCFHSPSRPIFYSKTDVNQTINWFQPYFCHKFSFLTDSLKPIPTPPLFCWCSLNELEQICKEIKIRKSKHLHNLLGVAGNPFLLFLNGFRTSVSVNFLKLGVAMNLQFLTGCFAKSHCLICLFVP